MPHINLCPWLSIHFYFGFEPYRFLFSFFGSGEDDYAMAGYYSSQRGYGGSYGSSYGGSSSSAYTSSLRSNYMPVSLPLLGRLKSPQLFSFLRSFFASQPNQKQQKKCLFFAVMTKLERRQLKRSEDIRPSFVQRQVLGAKLLENAKVRRISRKGDKRRCVLMWLCVCVYTWVLLTRRRKKKKEVDLGWVSGIANHSQKRKKEHSFIPPFIFVFFVFS